MHPKWRFTFFVLFVSVMTLTNCTILDVEDDWTADAPATEHHEIAQFLETPDGKNDELQPDGDAGCEQHEEEVEPGICSYIVACNDAASCEAWAAAMLRDLENSYGDLTYAEAWDVDEEESEKEEITIASYEVNGNEIELWPTDEDEQYYAWLWERFTWLIPSDYREMVVRFDIYDHADMMAYVIQNEEDYEQWIYAANHVQPTYETERIMTDIHEFGHLLSLNAEQVDPYAGENECTTLMLDEGCAHEDAYIFRFYQQFWESDESENKDDYVTEYAMNSLHEDFAETWSYFVMTTRPEGNAAVDRKISFFYDYDEFIMLKAQILGRSASWIERNAEYE